MDKNNPNQKIGNIYFPTFTSQYFAFHYFLQDIYIFANNTLKRKYTILWDYTRINKCILILKLRREVNFSQSYRSIY